MRVYVLMEEVPWEGETLLGAFVSLLDANASLSVRLFDWLVAQPVKEGSVEKWVASDGSWDYAVHVFEVGK